MTGQEYNHIYDIIEDLYEQGNLEYNDFAFLCKTIDKADRCDKYAWHDLRKDPNDLPNENGEYWGYVEYFGILQHRRVWYDYKWEAGIKVIAWCELPKFEE